MQLTCIELRNGFFKAADALKTYKHIEYRLTRAIIQIILAFDTGVVVQLLR